MLFNTERALFSAYTMNIARTMASLVPIKLAKLSFKIGEEECQLSPLLSILTDVCYTTGLLFLCLTSLMALNGFIFNLSIILHFDLLCKKLITYFKFRYKLCHPSYFNFIVSCHNIWHLICLFCSVCLCARVSVAYSIYLCNSIRLFYKE